MIMDWRVKKLRWWYYASSLSGWVLFVPFIPAFKKVVELSDPHFWIPTPAFTDLLNLYTLEHKSFVVFLAILLVVFLLRKCTKEKNTRLRTDTPILFFGILFLLFPIAIWIYSQFFTSLFWPRYLIIFELGFTVAFAAIIARILPAEQQLRTFQKIIIACSIFVVMCLPFSGFITIAKEPVATGMADSSLPSDIPLVTINARSHTTRFYYNPLNKDYYYVLDWEYARRNERYGAAVQDFRTMSSMKRHFPDQNIMNYEDFLRTFKTFVVYKSTDWFNLRIRNNPQYSFIEIKPNVFQVQKLDDIQD